MRWFGVTLIFSLLLFAVNSEKFKVIREWKYINFTWPTEETYRDSISKGFYVPQNNVISGVKEYDNWLYLTLPRMKSGVPATLGRIPAGAVTTDTSPKLEPFPSWEMNKLGECSALQNVQNVEIDTKGQIWVIDSGRTETLDNAPAVRCRPKLIIFDIKKNMTITAYTFPDAVADSNSNFLYDIVVDDTNNGYAYITDNSARDPGIIVFSVKDHHSWKIRHAQSMRADPSASIFRVNDVMVQAPINIAGVALGPKFRNFSDKLVISEDRDLYYSPLSSLHLYSIKTSVLKNEMYGSGEYQGEVMDHGLKGSQSVGMIMDNKGVLYYSLLGSNSIARWDSSKPFEKSQRIIARDQKYLEWPSSFSIDQNGNITVLVNRLNKFIYETFDLNEPNFRLITSHVGSKSYLYDQSYDYETTSTAVPGKQTDSVPEPDVLPHSDQDPNLMPSIQVQPETSSKKSEVEPTPEPEPNSNHTEHNHNDHDHMHNHQHMHDNEINSTETQKLADNSAVTVVSGFLSIMFVIVLQIVT